MAAKDYKQIFDALKEQGWGQEAMSNGHYKLVPPDKHHPMVCIATTSNDFRAIKNVIRDLRASGFVWPRQQVSRREPANDQEILEAIMGNVQSIRPDASNPFRPEEPEPTMDDLFRQLKESRTYASLAKEARDEAQAARDAAEDSLNGSEKELELAMAQLKKCKADFDKAFDEVK